MSDNARWAIIVAYFCAVFCAIAIVGEEHLRQQSIDMQESRPYAVVGE